MRSWPGRTPSSPWRATRPATAAPPPGSVAAPAPCGRARQGLRAACRPVATPPTPCRLRRLRRRASSAPGRPRPRAAGGPRDGRLRVARPLRADRGRAVGLRRASTGCTRWPSRTPSTPTSGPSSSATTTPSSWCSRPRRYVEHEQLTATSEVVDTGEVMVFVGAALRDHRAARRARRAARAAPPARGASTTCSASAPPPSSTPSPTSSSTRSSTSPPPWTRTSTSSRRRCSARSAPTTSAGSTSSSGSSCSCAGRWLPLEIPLQKLAERQVDAVPEAMTLVLPRRPGPRHPGARPGQRARRAADLDPAGLARAHRRWPTTRTCARSRPGPAIVAVPTADHRHLRDELPVHARAAAGAGATRWCSGSSRSSACCSTAASSATAGSSGSACAAVTHSACAGSSAWTTARPAAACGWPPRTSPRPRHRRRVPVPPSVPAELRNHVFAADRPWSAGGLLTRRPLDGRTSTAAVPGRLRARRGADAHALRARAAAGVLLPGAVVTGPALPSWGSASWRMRRPTSK